MLESRPLFSTARNDFWRPELLGNRSEIAEKIRSERETMISPSARSLHNSTRFDETSFCPDVRKGYIQVVPVSFLNKYTLKLDYILPSRGRTSNQSLDMNTVPYPVPISEYCPFGLYNLPFGIFSTPPDIGLGVSLFVTATGGSVIDRIFPSFRPSHVPESLSVTLSSSFTI